jgi:hypothetical protein
VLTNFLDTNASRLITVTSTSNVMFTLLAEYAPEYGCLLKGLADLDPRIEEAFRGGRLHVTLEVVKGRGKYVPGDEPITVTGRGPHCAGLPAPPQPYLIPPEFQHVDDGAPLVGGPGSGAMASPMRDAYGPGSDAENAMVNALIAQQYGTTPDHVPAIDTILAAPLLRGSEVTVR